MAPAQEPTTDAKPTDVVPPVRFAPNLLPLKQLKELAVTAYNIFSNSSKRQEVERLLWELKEALAEWAKWQESLKDEQDAA